MTAATDRRLIDFTEDRGKNVSELSTSEAEVASTASKDFGLSIRVLLGESLLTGSKLFALILCRFSSKETYEFFLDSKVTDCRFETGSSADTSFKA